MLKYVVEFLGTFVFLAVIMNTAFGAAGKTGLAGFPIGLALAAVIFFGGNISGGHFNPAVTIMQAVDGKISYAEAAPYIISQVIGGLSALRYTQLNKKNN